MVLYGYSFIVVNKKEGRSASLLVAVVATTAYLSDYKIVGSEFAVESIEPV